MAKRTPKNKSAKLENTTPTLENTTPAPTPMKFSINAHTLQTELNLISGVEDRRRTIPVLQNLSIVSDGPTSLKITATDLDVTLASQVEAVVSQPGSILVPLARLLDIVRTFPKTADISFQALDQGGAKITCERAKFTLVAPEFNAFPELPKTNDGEIEIQADTIASMIASTIFAITQEESRYTLSGAKLEIDQFGLRMVTTDGHRLAKSEVNTTTAKNPLDVLIPKKALAALKKICAAHDGPLKLATDENHAYFHVGSRILTARLLFGQFPNYQMVIPKDNNQSFTTNAALFRETLRRVSLMADERSHAVRLDIKTNSLRFHASHRDEGEAVEDLPIALETAAAAAGTTEKHNTLSIGINCEYLLDALGSITSEQATMSFKDQNSQIMIFPATPTPIQVSNVVMPMRI